MGSVGFLGFLVLRKVRVEVVMCGGFRVGSWVDVGGVVRDKRGRSK